MAGSRDGARPLAATLSLQPLGSDAIAARPRGSGGGDSPVTLLTYLAGTFATACQVTSQRASPVSITLAQRAITNYLP